jgi:hypothetical protein
MTTLSGTDLGAAQQDLGHNMIFPHQPAAAPLPDTLLPLNSHDASTNFIITSLSERSGGPSFLNDQEGARSSAGEPCGSAFRDDGNPGHTLLEKDRPHHVAITVPGHTAPEAPDLHSLFLVAASQGADAQGADRCLPIFGFSSDAVEDCYDASQGVTRLAGCRVACAISILAFMHRVYMHISGWNMWLPVTCVTGVTAVALIGFLCSMNDAKTYSKRHMLRKVALTSAFIIVIGTGTSTLTFVQESVHILSVERCSSSHVSWEEAIFLGFQPGLLSVGLPLFISLLLRVSFPWVTLVCIVHIIGFLIIILSAARAPFNMLLSTFMYALGTIGILYNTESSAQQRFLEQLQRTKMQRDLDLAKAKVVQMETAASLHRAQADLASDRDRRLYSLQELYSTVEGDAGGVGGVSAVSSTTAARAGGAEPGVDGGTSADATFASYSGDTVNVVMWGEVDGTETTGEGGGVKT